MINGYITYNELKLITGFSDQQLKKIIYAGLNSHEFELYPSNRSKTAITQSLYNLQEIEKWIGLHIY